ncbi:MAG: penicillin-binding transpeptidase domain-containing protein [Bacteroidota bacterium]
MSSPHLCWLCLFGAIAVALPGCDTPARTEGQRQLTGVSAPGTAATDTLRPDWSTSFEAEGAIGTFVLFDPATGHTQRFNPERAATRFTPASTSKLFNALVFLDQGVVSDPDSMHAWDGVERWASVWNQDHSLRTGVEVSAVWLFQRLALEVGKAGYDDVFARQPYGNAFMGDTLHMAWLNGSLQISADEQIAFLDGLRRGELAFSAEDQATVRDVMPVLADGDGWSLEGKTGWGVCCERPDIGWIVGWLKRPDGDLLYAMNAEEAPGQTFDVMRGRLRIVRAVLEAEGLIPPAEAGASG